MFPTEVSAAFSIFEKSGKQLAVSAKFPKNWNTVNDRLNGLKK